ncbi:MAG: hypothetical protein Q9188_006864 [Gyalolechia gomerana]
MLKSLAHWGSSKVTGRGLLALAGRGSIAQIKLETRLNDVLTNRDVNEIAGAPTSAVPNNSHAETNTSIAAASQQPGIFRVAITKPAQLSTARIGSDGKVIFTKGGAGE